VITINILIVLCAVGGFVLSFFIYQLNFLSFLVEYRNLFIILHAISASIGLGTATATDFLFFKFLKDFKISKAESNVMSMLSQLIWLAILMIVITGVLIYIPESQRLNQTPKFLVKALIVLIVIVNGAFLNLLIAPKLVKISFNEKESLNSFKMKIIKSIAFALGAISIVSWYSAFLLGSLKKVELGFFQIFSIYLAILFLAIIGSQFLERYLVKKSQNQKAV